MASSFEGSLSEFREFLRNNDYPQRVAWVESGDVLLSGGRLIYVRVPVPETNEQHVRELFDRSQNSNKGMLFGTICAIEDTTYAYVWMPRDATEAECALMTNGLKMSAKTGLGKVPGKAIHSRLWWTYLQWALSGKQQNKNQLFC